MRIGIDYCAIDNSDVKCIYQDINSITLPFIPGSEYSGEVLEIGPKCQKQFHVGDKVAVLGKLTKQNEVMLLFLFFVWLLSNSFYI